MSGVGGGPRRVVRGFKAKELGKISFRLSRLPTERAQLTSRYPQRRLPFHLPLRLQERKKPFLNQ